MREDENILTMLGTFDEERKAIVPQQPPRNMKELKQRLRDAGEEWRNEHAKVNEKTGEVKLLPCSPRAVADILKREAIFILIGDYDPERSQLAAYDWDSGIYRTGERWINKLVLTVERTLNQQHCKTVQHFLTVESTERQRTEDRNLIVVENGIYSLSTKELEPFNPGYVFTSKVATRWIKDAPKPGWDVDSWIDTIANHDKDVVTLLWQIIAECLNGNYTRGKFFVLVGSGNNGKGTFTSLLIQIIGHANVSNLRMEQIGERFSPSTMAGRVANIGDDIKGDYLPESQNLLSITTGDPIMIEEKGKQAYSITLNCTMVFSANKVPKIRNTTNGLYRRMCIVPFLADFNGHVEDKSIKSDKVKRKDVHEYILFKALSSDFDKFIEPQIVKELMIEYRKMNDSLVEFYEEVWFFDEYAECEKIPTDYVYNVYTNYCSTANYKPKALRSFVMEFEKTLGDQWEKKRARPGNDFLDNDWHMTRYGKPLQCFCKS